MRYHYWQVEEIRNAVLRSYDDARERLQRIAESLPKRNRRTSVVCPVTGELTSDKSGLSTRAWELIEKGLEYERWREQRTQEAQTYYATYSWVSSSLIRPPAGVEYRYDFRDVEARPEFSLLKMLAKFTHQPLLRLGSSYNRDVPRLEGQPEKTDHLEGIELTPEQAEIVKRYGNWLDWWLQERYRDGYRDGSNMLLKMASGDLTIDQVNALSTKRENALPTGS